MLFDTFSARSLQLANRMVMAPLTRSRATPQRTPNALMATYYGQRATAGQIITEVTSPSPNGLGYPSIPGLYDTAQAWKATTATVHAQRGKIFVRLMHCGRVGHVANLPAGAEVPRPGTAVCTGEMYTDTPGMQPHSPQLAMTDDDLAHVIDENVAAAKLAVDAGLDGVELHGANGYLIEQFLNPLVNLRTDGHGDSNERRNRLALEIALAAVAAIGRGRVGMRLSPYGVFNGTAVFSEVQAQYLTLVHSLSVLGLLYLYLVDHSTIGAPPVPGDFKLKLRAGFDGLFILSGGFDYASAEQALHDKRGDQIAFGRPFLANPDLKARMRKDLCPARSRWRRSIPNCLLAASSTRATAVSWAAWASRSSSTRSSFAAGI